MEIIIFMGGALLGSIFTTLFKDRSETYGIIEIDHTYEECKVHLTSRELLNRKKKKAIFEIDHDAKFSREEQSL